MIIFGTRQRFKTIDTGEFYCPQCRARRSYVHKQARPYFALYFVPVFPVGQGHELIECGTCGTQFAMDVLQATPPQPRPDLASLINGVGRDLAAGQPVEFVIRTLTGHGLDLDAARHVVEGQLGPDGARLYVLRADLCAGRHHLFRVRPTAGGTFYPPPGLSSLRKRG